jgi:hypothetical protein
MSNKTSHNGKSMLTLGTGNVRVKSNHSQGDDHEHKQHILLDHHPQSPLEMR